MWLSIQSNCAVRTWCFVGIASFTELFLKWAAWEWFKQHFFGESRCLCWSCFKPVGMKRTFAARFRSCVLFFLCQCKCVWTGGSNVSLICVLEPSMYDWSPLFSVNSFCIFNISSGDEQQIKLSTALCNRNLCLMLLTAWMPPLCSF